MSDTVGFYPGMNIVVPEFGPEEGDTTMDSSTQPSEKETAYQFRVWFSPHTVMNPGASGRTEAEAWAKAKAACQKELPNHKIIQHKRIS
jgi:hypothetical protein